MKVFLAGNQVCMKRGLDAERFQRYVEANGSILVQVPQDADVIVAITCAFVESYADYAVAMLKSLKSYGKRLVVLGCLPPMFPEKFASVFQGDWLPVSRFDEMDKLFPDFNIALSSIPDSHFPDTSVMLPFSADAPCPISIRNGVSAGKTFGPFIRISEGCNNRCTYCSHPAALGPLRSKPIEDCIKECKELVAQGYCKITIHANDPGAYGIDMGLTYPKLLRSCLDSSPAEVSFTLNDVGPVWLMKYRKELLELMESNRITGIGIPLQSGSPRILRLMKRPNALDGILNEISAFREVAPKLLVTSHLISGFPTETDEDVEMTIDFMGRLKPAFVYVFRYSANPSTQAAKLQPQFTLDELNRRQSRFVELLRQTTEARVEAFT